MAASRSAAFSVPVPTGGWNARDSLYAMKPDQAIRLTNLFPNTNTVDIRNGFRTHSTGLGAGVVEWMAEFAAQDGTRKLIGFANNKIYNASTLAGVATDITAGSAITTNRWATVNFRNTLIMVNGTDQCRQYDGTTVADAVYTGTGLTDNDLIFVCVYKSRLYFVQKNSANIWYTDVNSITGALTKLDVSGLLEKGGNVQYISSFTRDLGDGTDSLFVVVSSVGEILVYSGDFPGAINWIVATRFFLPVSLGRHASLQMGSDLLFITETGLLSLAGVMSGADAQNPDQNISFKINNAFRLAAQNYKSNYGWQVINYPRGHYLAVNIPVAQAATFDQYVMNTETGAWCKFTGENAVSWCLFNEKLYFGGINGTIYEADYGQIDGTVPITVDMKGSFNYLGNNKVTKRFTMARPILVATNDFSFVFNVDVDFDNRQITDIISVVGSSGSIWDAATWDSATWDSEGNYTNQWYSVSGIGKCVAPRLSGSFSNVTFSLASIDYIYELGGIF